jgi:VWFA-related protein
MRYTAYVLLSALVATCAVAQEQPAGETPLLRTTTRAVVLDVTVIDAHGVPIKGLTRDDFVVTEDGVGQRIASFETSATELQQASEPPSQTVIILDELNTQFVDIAYARYSLEKYLKRSSGQLDRPAQLLALTDHGFDLVHDYTRNGSELLQSLERLPARLPFRLGLRGASGLSDRLNISLGGLKQVARANAYSGKRTTIIWVSPGFPVITPFNLDPVQRQDLLNVLRNLSDELLRWRVTVYSIDPRGVFNNGENRATNAFLGSLEANSTAFGDLALERLAVETGGRAFYGRNDVNNLVATSIVQSNLFYTLSYYPSNTNEDGTFRKIRVAIEKPGLTARTRDGYYAVAESPLTPKDVTLSVKQALVNPLVYRGIAVSIANAVANANSDSAVSVAIDGNALDWEPSAGGNMRFHVMVGVADFAGHDVTYSHIAAFDGEMAAAKFQTGVSKRVMITVKVPVERKSSVLRIVVCDLKNGRLGTAEAAW